MSSRAAAAADLRSRIAGNLTASASGEGPEPPASVVAGVNALPTPPSRESGVPTHAPGAAAELLPAEPAPAAAPEAVPPAAAAVAARTPAPSHALPAPAAVAKGWEKLSITLARSDFGILDVQTGQARAAGIKMRRGGNPSVFLRAALRNLEALRLTNPSAWLELVRGTASSDTM